ncbi:MAG: Dabb family protein [Deltaproteobacteria bacterium]|nr:Dabb family protein [Deltaproteobacteria bacterium]
MFTHIVFFKLKDGALREEVCARVWALRGAIPALRGLEAGADVVRSGRSWDVALVARFTRREDLAEYAEHPAHREFLAYLTPRLEASCAVDYETPEDAPG